MKTFTTLFALLFFQAILLSQCVGDIDQNTDRGVSDLLLFNSVYGVECPPVEEIAPSIICTLNDPCDLFIENNTVIKIGSSWEPLDEYIISNYYHAAWCFKGDTISTSWDLGPVSAIIDSICIGQFELELRVRNSVSGAWWSEIFYCYIIQTCADNPPTCSSGISFSLASAMSALQTPGLPGFTNWYYVRKFFRGFKI